MRSTLPLLPLLLSLSLTNAQYFSEGWKPGQAVTREAQPAAATDGSGAYNLNFDFEHSNPHAPNTNNNDGYTPPAAPEGSRGGGTFLTRLLTSPPLSTLFNRAGINITQKLSEIEASAAEKPWDTRVQMITDENFDEVVRGEVFDDGEEEGERVWCVIVSGTAARQAGISKYFDEMFDLAYNNTLIAGDLPHVKWGRIDYLNVTYLTTKWSIWQAPVIIIATNRAQTLRFYKPHQLRVRDGALRDFLLASAYTQTPPWSSSFAPGGSNEYILEFIATWWAKAYNLTMKVPRWILFLASGSVASLLINLMHRLPGGSLSKTKTKEKKSAPKKVEAKAEVKSTSVPLPPQEVEVPSTTTSATASGTKSKTGTKRKSRK